jgi:NitT/TauT family transport system substrate-binding protein
MALVMIADHEKFFSKEGVDVDLKEFTAGKFALQAFLGGSLDTAIAGEVPTGLALLQGEKLAAVGEVLRNSHGAIRMVVRNKGGCGDMTPSHYFRAKRRKIATSFGGGPEYFTVRFFETNNIPYRSDVELVSQTPEQMPAAVVNGAVDGISVFDPAASTAESLLGANHCTFPDSGAYREHYVVVVRPGDSHADPRLAKFMAALRDAEGFAKEHPDQAQAIVGAKTKLGTAKVAQMWPEFDFGVTLDPKLPELWEQEAEWHREKAQGSQLAHPDYAAAVDRTLVGAN